MNRKHKTPSKSQVKTNETVDMLKKKNQKKTFRLGKL